MINSVKSRYLQYLNLTIHARCTSCHDEHPNPITINRFDPPEGSDEPGPNNGINFLMKCKSCRNEMRITFKSDKTVAKAFTIEASEQSVKKPVLMLKMDTRGVDVVEFIPDGKFVCKSAESSHKFEEIDLEENEWYDYDDNAGAEVSITEVKWSIAKLKN